ncbi:MAG: NADH-quinone oxidoreductase subunit NuoN [Hyphomicrobiaceae bacterium]
MDAFITSLGSYAPLYPEIVIAIGALAVLMLGVFAPEKAGDVFTWAAIAIMGLAAFLVLGQGLGAEQMFGGSFVTDQFAHFMKLLALTGSIVTLFMSRDTLRAANLLSFEFAVLILFATLGMLVMISAGDLISMYLGLEMQSLALYVIAAIRRDSLRSSEAGLKYFVLGALSSGMLLYGASLIYGFTGSTLFADIATSVTASSAGTGPGIGLVFGLVFVLAGLAFKISAVPFHMWTPDVYEGAPTPITAFFAAAPKIAAMALLMRITIDAFPGVIWQWQQVLVFIAIASMLWGAFAALGQTNIKRLMAYSSIGHMGFALVGLAAGTEEGTKSVLIYLAIYLVMTLGAFACILAMRRNDAAVEEINDLSGLAQNNLPMAFFLAMLLFSLAGIPPLAGFFAKFYVFRAAVQADLWPLAILGVLASVVGAVYYIRIIKLMFFDEPAETFDAMPANLKLVLGAAGLFILLYAVYPAPLVTAAQAAAKSIFPG